MELWLFWLLVLAAYVCFTFESVRVPQQIVWSVLRGDVIAFALVAYGVKQIIARLVLHRGRS